MSIKVYKGRVVPCSCKKEWTWMLDEEHLGCSENIGETRDFIGCTNISCCDCIYSSNPQREEYYKHCFPEARPKLTQKIFDRPDCPDWAQYAAVDSNGSAYWYDDPPRQGEEQWHTQRVDVYNGGVAKVKRLSGRYEASDWKNSLIARPASRACSTCKNYEPKDSPDREMIPVYEFDWYTQWKYSQREDKYYYIEDISKNRARELKTGKLVNELPADVIVVSPADPDPAVLIATAVQHVPTGNYYVIQKVEGDGSRIYVKDMDWEKSEFYKNFIDKWGRPVCYFTKATGD